MNTIQRKIPNKIKSNLLLESNLSGMLITHAIIQGIVFIGLIILFGTTENMHIFSVMTSAMTIVLIMHIVTFFLYKSEVIDYQMKRGNHSSTSLTGFVLSPVGVIVQLVFSSTFNAMLFWSENLPGWQTHFEVGFTNILGILLGVIFSYIFIYVFFLKKEDYTTKEYYQKMKECYDLYPDNDFNDILRKTDEYFEYGMEFSYDNSREIIPFNTDVEDENLTTVFMDDNDHENSNEYIETIETKETVNISSRKTNNGKTIRQKR